MFMQFLPSNTFYFTNTVSLRKSWVYTQIKKHSLTFPKQYACNLLNTHYCLKSVGCISRTKKYCVSKRKLPFLPIFRVATHKSHRGSLHRSSFGCKCPASKSVLYIYWMQVSLNSENIPFKNAKIPEGRVVFLRSDTFFQTCHMSKSMVSSKRHDKSGFR